MELKISKNTFKKKLINNITKKGKKQSVEKTLLKSIKQLQKQKKKYIPAIIQLAIVNTTSTFKMINLTNKRRRKKSVKRIPTMLYNNKFRNSLGLKNLVKSAVQITRRKVLHEKISEEFFLVATLESDVVNVKKDQQVEASKEKKYFRYYRW